MRARSHLLWRFLRPENGVHLTTRSTGPRRKALRASSPLAAVSTVNPKLRSAISSISLMTASSSTIKISNGELLNSLGTMGAACPGD